MTTTTTLVPVCSELVGSILSVDLVVGAEVQPSSVVAVLESMKMEIPILADTAGWVRSIEITGGDQVDAGSVIARIEPRA